MDRGSKSTAEPALHPHAFFSHFCIQKRKPFSSPSYITYKMQFLPATIAFVLATLSGFVRAGAVYNPNAEGGTGAVFDELIVLANPPAGMDPNNICLTTDSDVASSAVKLGSCSSDQSAWAYIRALRGNPNVSGIQHKSLKCIHAVTQTEFPSGPSGLVIYDKCYAPVQAHFAYIDAEKIFVSQANDKLCIAVGGGNDQKTIFLGPRAPGACAQFDIKRMGYKEGSKCQKSECATGLSCVRFFDALDHGLCVKNDLIVRSTVQPIGAKPAVAQPVAQPPPAPSATTERQPVMVVPNVAPPAPNPKPQAATAPAKTAAGAPSVMIMPPTILQNGGTRCGTAFGGVVCLAGQSCSREGWCGYGPGFFGAGCQQGFGFCQPS